MVALAVQVLLLVPWVLVVTTSQAGTCTAGTHCDTASGTTKAKILSDGPGDPAHVQVALAGLRTQAPVLPETEIILLLLSLHWHPAFVCV